MQKFDISNWKRKTAFYFFQDFEKPFFNICANLDVSNLRKTCKQKNASFFSASLFLAIKAANSILEFKLRLRGREVIVHDQLNVGSTVLNEDETFSFCYFDFCEDFEEFQKVFKKEIEENKLRGTSMEESAGIDDLIHFSVIPWVSFTSFSHARKIDPTDSVPRIVFGKFFEESEKVLMPVSVEAHHALVDGIHVGKFFEIFQNLLNEGI